ncbi:MULTISPECIES: metallophosphoesterase [Rhodanobacter]|uniref:metallophosphoesterase n=1 Tax=Rhodanobacter TaxID=75309 RepID=UPI0004149636|nr:MULTISPECIES: metallophosphoesterase [Rhodanobacter]TAN19325.1 MAG: metallophosphoesterase [Rhodanobacter sp.]UJJ53773.1 metallophosphoesterase family protein [Rhodanobacter thiooxydans]
MRLHILSDLHLSTHGMPPPEVAADVTILAGDIRRPAAEAMQWAASLGRPVLYVPGNHEFYGGAMPQVRQTLARSAREHGIGLLDQGTREIDGVRFVGATLWTDFALFGAGNKELAMAASASFMRDFAVIRNADGSVFTPADAAALFAEQYAWLAVVLAQPFAGPTVVVTHHAPTPRSVHPRFAESPVSAAFVSDCSALMGRATLWVHGHTHDSFDYTVNGTRVVCNPRGYSSNGVNENPHFDPCLCIEVEAGA